MMNATVFDTKAWEWNKDSLTIIKMQVAELQALCTRYNLKPAKTDKVTAATVIVNHLMIPRADVVTKQDVHNAIQVTMEQVAKNILASTIEAKIMIVTSQVETLQNKINISGEYTCLSNKGFNTVNYFLTTADQLEGVKRLEVNCDEKYLGHKDAHSDHRPLVLTITQQWQPPPVQQKAIKHLPHFKYDTAKATKFSKNVQ